MDEAEFQDAVRSCQTPTTSALENALVVRTRVIIEQSDYLTYLACFTHYGEAASVLPHYGISVYTETAFAYDHVNRCIHAKILVNDLTHQITSISQQAIQMLGGSDTFTNRVHRRLPSGEYVDRVDQQPGMTYLQYIASMRSQTAGLTEEVTPVATWITGGTRLVTHFVSVPHRNTDENIERLFQHVHSVIAANADDPMFNLSVHQLQQSPDIAEVIARPRWFIVPTESADDLARYLQRIHARYRLMGNDDSGSDYISTVRRDVEMEAMSLVSGLPSR